MLRLALAILIGKTVITVNQLLGKKGTSLPGMIAMKIDPDLIKKLRSRHDRVIAVTGTNGKTTTSNLLAAILRQQGLEITHNTAGANMVSGIATAFIHTASILGLAARDVAVIEIDEATMPKAIPMVKPDMVIITNFFRDQLDRYGELDKTIELTVASLGVLKEAKVILNADDPLVATIGRKINLPVIYYGVAPNKYSMKENAQMVEGRYCPFCQHEYKYEYYQYGQLGGYYCTNCGYRRPEPQYLIIEADLSEPVSFKLEHKGNVEEYKLALEGFYNLYNALAAVAGAAELGIGEPVIRAGLEQYAPNAGRMEKFKIKGRETTLALVKNPTGFNEVLKTLVSAQGRKSLILAINDLAADGRDVSWLWDVDFEILSDESVDFVVCTGLRGEDMAVRLKYAGVANDKIITVKDLREAIETAVGKSDINNKIAVLPTYTNLFPAEDILHSLAKDHSPLVKVGEVR